MKLLVLLLLIVSPNFAQTNSQTIDETSMTRNDEIINYEESETTNTAVLTPAEIIIPEGIFTNKKIVELSPQDRRILAESMKEVGDTYQQANESKKAREYHMLAYALYPIGDEGSKLANQLGFAYDEQHIYNYFVNQGDLYRSEGNYEIALHHYLLAREIFINNDLLSKLSEAYRAMGNDAEADYYQNLYTNNGIPTEVQTLDEDTSVQYESYEESGYEYE